MSRIEHTFKALDRPALITFITAGDPDEATSRDMLQALADGGADLIELGMPFTDPVADGPAIQAASQRALKAGANMKQTLRMVSEFRKTNDQTPIILMGYMNPIHHYGIERFINDAADCGVDGLIIVDLPPEEDSELRELAQDKEIDVIRLITPTTDEERLKTLTDGASGFLYYVSITGVTGSAKAKPEDIAPHIQAVKKHTDLPVAIGFGIKTPEDAAAMGGIADGVVVGSAIVNIIAEKGASAETKSNVKTIVSGLSSALKNKCASAA